MVKHLRIHREQKVCEQEVIMGVLKKSLHTRQRSAFSTELSCETGVLSQSDGSGRSNELSIKAESSCDL